MKHIFLSLLCFLVTACATNNSHLNNSALQRAVDSSLAIGAFFPVYENTEKLTPKTKPKLIGHEFKIFGSGVAIKKSNSEILVITAEHVAMLFYPQDLWACSMGQMKCAPLGNKLVLELDVAKKDLGSDWALYKVDNLPEGTVPISFSKRKPVLGEPVWAIGMPYGRSPRVTKGHVSWFLDGGRKNELIAVDGFAAPGFSGGGIFSINGVLVGIVVAIEMNPKGEQSTDQVVTIPLSNIWAL